MSILLHVSCLSVQYPIDFIHLHHSIQFQQLKWLMSYSPLELLTTWHVVHVVIYSSIFMIKISHFVCRIEIKIFAFERSHRYRHVSKTFRLTLKWMKHESCIEMQWNEIPFQQSNGKIISSCVRGYRSNWTECTYLYTSGKRNDSWRLTFNI